jgi:hypothetical protein
MPLIKYLCDCNTVSKFFRNPKDAPSSIPCEICGKSKKKQLSSSYVKSIVIVDNGVQARQVEVDLDLVKDIEDRSTKDFKEK